LRVLLTAVDHGPGDEEVGRWHEQFGEGFGVEFLDQEAGEMCSVVGDRVYFTTEDSHPPGLRVGGRCRVGAVLRRGWWWGRFGVDWNWEGCYERVDNDDG
jgi:hypothetical protein